MCQEWRWKSNTCLLCLRPILSSLEIISYLRDRSGYLSLDINPHCGIQFGSIDINVQLHACTLKFSFTLLLFISDHWLQNRQMFLLH